MKLLIIVIVFALLAPLEAEQRVCGTRWLALNRQQLPLPAAAKRAAPLQAEIKVGTQLGVPVSGDLFLRPSTCRYVGEHCYIFVEDSQWDVVVVQPDVDRLGLLFDEATPADAARGIYDLASEVFGPVPDVDGDPRVFIHLIDMIEDSVVGYFDPRISESVDAGTRRDAIYLNAFRFNAEPFLVRGTLAHEFQHLIHWGHDGDEEDWIEEGLSGYAEELTGFAETDPNMVSAFLEQPGIDLTAWPFLLGTAELTRHYGATYLFFSFLNEHYGPDLIKAIVAEPRNGIFGIDEAFKHIDLVQHYAGAWGLWIAGNYAADDSFYGYGALRGRRVFVYPETAPFEPKPGQVSRQWGTTNIILRSSGDIQVDFFGSLEGRYAVWAYGMRGQTGEMVAVELDEANAGLVQMTAVDSVAIIVGRTSRVGEEFSLAARNFTPNNVPTVVASAPSGNASFVLGRSYPNPFNSAVILPFSMDEHGAAELDIHNSLGQLVRRLHAGPLPSGEHRLHWDGRDDYGRAVGSGLYQAVLRAQGQVQVRGLTLLK